MEESPQKHRWFHSLRSQIKNLFATDRVREAEVMEQLQSDKNTLFAWQRNHMANERTFLAWCRTGISLIVFSFVIERFDLLIRELRYISPNPERYLHMDSTRYMAMVVFVLGAFIMILAGWRFFYMRHRINLGESSFTTLPDTFLMIAFSFTLAMIFLLFVFVF